MLLCCFFLLIVLALSFKLRSIDIATNHETRSMLCQPIRGNRGGGRVIGVVELLNKIEKDGENVGFTDSDEDVLSSMTGQITDVLYLEFQELVNINDSLSSFATPIIPQIIEAKQRKNSLTNKKGYEQGTASSSQVNAHDQYKQLGAKKEMIDSQFVLGGPSKSQKEKGRARVTRRKSFSEELNMEIKQNPELLHVRKD